MYARIDEYGIETDFSCQECTHKHVCEMWMHVCCIEKTFQGTPVRNTKSWNPLIDGFMQNGKHKKALRMFEEMSIDGLIPVVVGVLSSCSQLGDLFFRQSLVILVKGDTFTITLPIMGSVLTSSLRIS